MRRQAAVGAGGARATVRPALLARAPLARLGRAAAGLAVGGARAAVVDAPLARAVEARARGVAAAEAVGGARGVVFDAGRGAHVVDARVVRVAAVGGKEPGGAALPSRGAGLALVCRHALRRAVGRAAVAVVAAGVASPRKGAAGRVVGQAVGIARSWVTGKVAPAVAAGVAEVDAAFAVRLALLHAHRRRVVARAMHRAATVRRGIVQCARVALVCNARLAFKGSLVNVKKGGDVV